MKKFLLCVLCYFVIACANQSVNGINDANMSQEEFMNDLLLEKINKNGSDLFCEQKSYTECFNISATQCKVDMAPYKDDCFQQASQKSLAIVSKNKMNILGVHYATCMMINHVTLYVDKVESISNCLQKLDLNKNSMLKSLFK